MSKFFLLICDEGREPAVRREVVAGMQIGRRKDLQCVLEDPNAGRVAARIVEERGDFFVEDLGSTNPTAIRGARKLAKGEREALRHGLIFEIGRSTIEVEEDRPNQPRSAADLKATESYSARDVPSGEHTLVGKSFGRGDSTHAEPLTLPNEEPAVLPERPATPQPVPAQRPLPSEIRPAPPVPASGRFAASDEPVGEGTVVTAPKAGDPAALATMLAHAPRIVIANEADRRVVPLRKMVTVIGRKHGECTIESSGVSQPHAEIRFIPQTNSFQIVDQGSKNNTFVGGLALTPHAPQLLSPECLLQFGPIHAVFVVAHDNENVPVPPKRYEAALQILVAEQQITPEQLRAARERALPSKQHVGVELMLANVISARAWTKAFETARRFEAPDLSGAARPSDRRLVWTLVGILVCLLILAWILREKLGW